MQDLPYRNCLNHKQSSISLIRSSSFFTSRLNIGLVQSIMHSINFSCSSLTVLSSCSFECNCSSYWFDILFNQTLIKSLGETNILSFNKLLILYHFVLCTWCCFTNHFRRLYIYIYILPVYIKQTNKEEADFACIV